MLRRTKFGTASKLPIECLPCGLVNESTLAVEAPQAAIRLDTKIAIVLDRDLAMWQKLNVTAFLASGIAATAAEAIGLDYVDADGTRYAPMFGQPVMVFSADRTRLVRTLERAVARGVSPAIFTSALFGTAHDAENRAAVAAVGRDAMGEAMGVVGLAVRAERKVVDKIVNGLTLHE
jgi:hypothetical protein